MKNDFKEQVEEFLKQKKKHVCGENLFYTSSKYKFLGVLKLWIYDTSSSGVFTDHQAEKIDESHINIGNDANQSLGNISSYIDNPL